MLASTMTMPYRTRLILLRSGRYLVYIRELASGIIRRSAEQRAAMECLISDLLQFYMKIACPCKKQYPFKRQKCKVTEIEESQFGYLVYSKHTTSAIQSSARGPLMQNVNP